MADEWEIVIDNYHHSVRRIAVPTGWIYQTQDGRRYSSAPGTVGRERDQGVPTWGPLVFVPKAPHVDRTGVDPILLRDRLVGVRDRWARAHLGDENAGHPNMGIWLAEIRIIDEIVAALDNAMETRLPGRAPT